MIETGLVKVVTDFIKWILEFIFPNRVKIAPVDLTAIYDKRRILLPKKEKTLIEILEFSPHRHFSTIELTYEWNEKTMKYWKIPVTEGECRAILRDWSNNERYNLVIWHESIAGRNLWYLNPEYQENRTKPQLDETTIQNIVNIENDGISK